MVERHWFERNHEQGIFARVMAGLATEHGEWKTVMIDPTYLKGHRAATSLAVKKGAWAPDWQDHRRHEDQAARHL